jgi:O-acetyl-ADP-ribose deacetylase (regulator of RNase III)
VKGDLLDQDARVIANAWNRNVIPWWLLMPRGVSGAIKRRAGLEPFRELARMRAIPLGGAVVTGSGRLPFEAIIHVAGIDLPWRSSEAAIRDCIRNSMEIINARGWPSVAFPVIGADSGGFPHAHAREIVLDALKTSDSTARAVLVDFADKT